MSLNVIWSPIPSLDLGLELVPATDESDALGSTYIALHVDRPFADQVAWLLEQLNRLGPLLPPFRQRQVGALYDNVDTGGVVGRLCVRLVDRSQ